MVSGIRIRCMVPSDIAPALQLCRSAGWNQIGEDWSRLMEYQPGGCFVAEVEDQITGTVTTTSYGNELAWIGMMLVHPDFRRRGIATALMNHCLQYLRSINVTCIKLDATPDGRFVYEQLGFAAEWDYQRWCLSDEFSSSMPTTSSTPNGDRNDLKREQLDFDRTAFGVDRARWLSAIANASSVRTLDDGYAMMRSGHLADYLGPIVTRRPDDARRLIQELISHSTGRQIFWDVINPSAVPIAKELGFQPVRELTRMWIGSKLLAPPIESQFAICDPGTG